VGCDLARSLIACVLSRASECANWIDACDCPYCVIGAVEQDRFGLVRLTVMAIYRIYVLNADGRISSPPHVVESADDREAIQRAQQFTDARLVEIWREAMRIARLEPKK